MIDQTISTYRLNNQAISQTNFESAEAVLNWMGAMQAQDYAQALWAVGLRMKKGSLAAVETAIAEAKIVRTWVMRGTIHFAPAQDVLWMLELAAARILARDQTRLAQLELSVDDMQRCMEIMQRVLAEGKILTRAQLLEALENRGISTKNQRGYHILWYAGQAGLICMGPMQEKQQSFVLLNDWVPNLRRLSKDEALAELAKRYVNSHAPTTPQDFAWWAGLTLTEARRGFADAGLHSEKIGETTYWMEKAPPPVSANTNTYFLPGYDEYLLGYKERGAVITPENAKRVVPGSNGVFFPIIVKEGQVAGVWKRKIGKNGVEITIDPFLALTEADTQAAIAAYRAFL